MARKYFQDWPDRLKMQEIRDIRREANRLMMAIERGKLFRMIDWRFTVCGPILP